jgi:hypothetical protein
MRGFQAILGTVWNILEANLVTPAGIEPATFSLEEGCCSNGFKAHSDKRPRICPVERKREFSIVGTTIPTPVAAPHSSRNKIPQGGEASICQGEASGRKRRDQEIHSPSLPLS